MALQIYFHRLASFRGLANLDSAVRVTRLAKGGFIYTGQECTIICSGCQKKHDLLPVAIDPTSSAYHNRGCVFIQPDEQLYSEVAETYSSAAELSLPEANTTLFITPSIPQNLNLLLSSLPISPDGLQTSQQTYAEPVYPHYATVQKRYETFVNCHISHIKNFNELAVAGFFVHGHSIRCFQCGLCLDALKHGSNIYEKHVKRRPSCSLLHIQPVSETTIPEDFSTFNQHNEISHQSLSQEQSRNSEAKYCPPSDELLCRNAPAYFTPGDERPNDSVLLRSDQLFLPTASNFVDGNRAAGTHREPAALLSSILTIRDVTSNDANNELSSVHELRTGDTPLETRLPNSRSRYRRVVKETDGEPQSLISPKNAHVQQNFSVKYNRINSFLRGPQGLRPYAYNLADCGFFYTDQSIVRCYYCNLGWNTEPNDGTVNSLTSLREHDCRLLPHHVFPT